MPDIPISAWAWVLAVMVIIGQHCAYMAARKDVVRLEGATGWQVKPNGEILNPDQIKNAKLK